MERSRRQTKLRGLARFRALLAGAALVAAREPVAHAQTPSEIATAKEWFAEGLAREEKGDYARALELFRRAVQVKKTPQIAYHVAFCESRTGALVLAMLDLDSVANLARSMHADNVVMAAQAELGEVKKRVPTLLVRSAGTDRATKLVVDGSPIALAMLGTAMPLDPGDHTVTLGYASGARGTRRATLVEHDAKTVDIAPEAVALALAPPAPFPLAPVSTATAVQPEPPPLTPAPAHASGGTLPWLAVGVGTALFAGGVVLFADAWAKEGDLHDQCATRANCSPSLQGTYTTARTLDGVGVGLGVAGIVVAGLGVTVLLLHPSSSTTASLQMSPHGAAALVRF